MKLVRGKCTFSLLRVEKRCSLMDLRAASGKIEQNLDFVTGVKKIDFFHCLSTDSFYVDKKPDVYCSDLPCKK